MKISIHHKIVLIFACTVALILSGAFFYLNKSLRLYTFQRIENNLSKNSALSKIYLQDAIEGSFTDEQIDPFADAIGQNLNARATIISLEGAVLGDSQINADELKDIENHLYRPEIQDALKTGFGESKRFSTTIQKDMLYVARLFEADSNKGFIRLAIPLSEIEMISDELKRNLLISLIFAFLLAILIGSLGFIFVTKSIREISSVAKEIAMGNYSKRVLIRTNDELEELGKSINYMSEQIRNRIDEVISSKSRFEAVLLSMNEGVMVVDKNGTIILMNKNLTEYFHIDKDPIGHKPLEMIRNIEIQEIVDEVIHTKKSIASQEVTILLQEEKIMQVYAAPVLRESELDGVVLVLHDITELRRLENVRKDFVANVSHEIRTPLTSIKGYAETLLDGALDDQDHAKDFLKIMGADANRLVQLVDDLLDLSRIESGNLNLELSHQSVDEVIDRIITGLKNHAQKSGVTIKKDISGNLPKIKMDETSITQVLLNLIDNGIKYNQGEGTVTVAAYEEGDFVRIDVKDTGIGIPKEDLPRIFERFYRVDKARSRQLGGTGLGLSIVKHIVQAHGGDVYVDSELEKGSTFSIALPKTK